MTGENEKKGWFRRLKDGLQKSSAFLSEGVTSILKKKKLDQPMLDELEELLISADMGVSFSSRVVAELKRQRFNQDITDEELRFFVAAEIARVLEPVALPLETERSHPHVVLVVGVNGSGKTTTIGKLAHYWQTQGKKVTLVAGDTFRAAAVEQLKVWAGRLDVPIVVGKENADAAGLSFNAFEEARGNGTDILLIDTAGRLQNRDDLMAELGKIRRVLQKLDPSSPHTTLLVLDATTGQNAHSQVEIFSRIAGVTGLVMTKLDGTARGGVLVSLAERFGLPVHGIGVGEGVEDLRPFDARFFARNLLGLDEDVPEYQNPGEQNL